MGPRATRALERLSGSLWVIPVAMGGLGVILGVLLPWLDGRPQAREVLRPEWVQTVVASSPDGANELLGSMAGALATILGVVFSLTVVTLQLASQRFTPRVLRRFMSDRRTQFVLGAFVGTVAYQLLVLRAVEVGDAPDKEPFVPQISLFLGILATLACLGLVAYFIHHLSRSIQVSQLTAMVREEAAAGMAHMQLRPSGGFERPDRIPELVRTSTGGYLQLIDEQDLCKALPPGASAEVVARPGDFLLPGMPLVAVWPHAILAEKHRRQIERSFSLGTERSTRQDLLYGTRQLVDIALTALGTGMNDPTTVVLCVNQLGRLLHDFVQREPGPGDGFRVLRRGETEVHVPVVGLQTFATHAFLEIVQAGTSFPRVTARILEIFTEVAEQAPREELRAALRERGRVLLEIALVGAESDGDRRMLELRMLELERGGFRPVSREDRPLVH